MTRKHLRGGLAALDGACIIFAALIAASVMGRSATIGGDPFAELLLAAASVPLWIGAMAATGAYRAAYFNAGSDALRRFATGTAIGVLLLTFLAFLLNLPISRLFVGILALGALTFGALVRIAFRSALLRAYRQDRLTERTLVVGGEASLELVGLLGASEGVPYRAVGLIWTGPEASMPSVALPTSTELSEVRQLCDDLDVDVVLAAEGPGAGELQELFARLEGSPTRLIVTPALFPLLPWRMTVETITGLPLIHVTEVALSGWRAIVKRSLDLIGGTVLLAVLAPIAAIGALIILIRDGRPVVFHQQRIGRDGAPFRLWKLRTMVVDAEQRLPELTSRNEAGEHFFKLSEDPRVTPVGRVLRRWSIDEIPQLVNVLRGEMSLVGPRPLFSLPEQYDFTERRRLSVRPGLTGLWQVSGRSRVDGRQAIQKDLFYVENWSLVSDLIILVRTVTSILRRDGAL